MSRSINWINPSPPKRLLGVQVPHGTPVIYALYQSTSYILTRKLEELFVDFVSSAVYGFDYKILSVERYALVL